MVNQKLKFLRKLRNLNNRSTRKSSGFIRYLKDYKIRVITYRISENVVQTLISSIPETRYRINSGFKFYSWNITATTNLICKLIYEVN